MLPARRPPLEAVDDGRQLGLQLARCLQRCEHLGRGGVAPLSEPPATGGHVALDAGAGAR
jgi:hypothetical protein